MTDAVRYLERDGLQDLIQGLQKAGYHCVGPQIRDGAIVYDSINHVDQLPRGYSDHQSPGQYRLQQDDNPRCFAWANGPQAIKPYVFAAEEILWRSLRDTAGELQFTEHVVDVGPLAIIGVRACDLAALYLQDKHFLHTEPRDPGYLARRQQLLLVAVNCTHPAATCFCASTGDGPRATYGYDIVLSELDAGYLIEGRSQQGLTLLAGLPTRPATQGQLEQGDVESHQAVAQQTRRLPGHNLKQALFANLNHARWEEVAKRCLSCGNCTAVCPTCFCHAEQDRPALDGTSSDHVRQWDSCFTQGHSYIHGFTLRANTAQRYRQWLTHKLGSWHDQYGRSGCVGCGRCISWCPVGIDLTEEAAAICGDGEP
ncbi:MAG: 4Fe-4S dicluster domain-containing protein [Proteobacteria bacterium]|nr:4Fe-4S dicluster domain-containing protein [Pseudomonadota bacterium]